jgi:hypothetical protein
VTLNTDEVLAEIDSVFERCGASKDRPVPPKKANPPLSLPKRLEVRVRVSVFDDFLDMAEHIRSIHVAPAVVLAGSVHEEHARKLAEKNEIDLVDECGKTRAFEQLGHALVREEVFGEPQAEGASRVVCTKNGGGARMV